MSRRTGATGPKEVIRRPLRGDAANLLAMTRMAHPRIAPDLANILSDWAYEQRRDSTDMHFKARADDTVVDVPFLSSLRVLSRPGQDARSFVHFAPPVDWVLREGRRAGLTIPDRAALCGALTECNLMATLPRWRGNGYASQLLADAENRYRKAGWRAVVAVMNISPIPDGSPDGLADWYAKRGYTIGDPDTPAMLQFWGSRMHTTGQYQVPLARQYLGFKALHDEVTVTNLDGTIHVRALIGA